jgi:PAS domain S-box-containing protein
VKKILDDGLDELAVSAHAGFWPRIAVTVATAGVFGSLLPWRMAAIWLCITLALEIQAWFATRAQFLGRPVGWRVRLWHVFGLGAEALGWIALGGLGWATGRPEAMLCGSAIWLVVIFFSQTNAYQSATGFVVGGAIPAAVAMAIAVLSPPAASMHLGAFVVILLLSFAFAGEGAGRMLKAKARLSEAQERLRRSEALYRVLADNATDVISLTDVEGARIYMSPSAEKSLGYPLEELHQMPTFRFIHPDDQDDLRRKIETLPQVGRLTAEYRVVKADGEAAWVETSFTLAPQPDGRPPQIVSVARDAQSRKELEAKLIEARLEAEAAAAAKSDFLANMTHELRTPLNAIIGFAGLLNGSSRLDDQDARHARLIGEASGTLLDLVNSVLDFSRLEAGAVELDPAPFDPTAEAGAIVELLSGQAAAKGLALELKAVPGAFVSGDAKRLRQVLLNFLSNAIKFTARGGVTLSLSQTPADEAGLVRLRVEVADTGVGIPQSQIDHVFERFTQADVSVSRRYGGTGLGLAICSRIVELMNGQIGARSVEGVGSTFWFEVSLPAAEAAGAQVEGEATTDLEHPVRMLLVEDVAINRELVKTVLAGFDIEIDTAEDGVAAIEAFRRGAYDIVLMDVQMPVMDGLTATRRIRALPIAAAATTPIIAMTANVLPDQIAKCVEAGMDSHLGKPMNPAELLNAIAHWTSYGRHQDERSEEKAPRVISA